MDNKIENLIRSIGKLRDFNIQKDGIREVKDNINSIFDKPKCINFVYTINTDKIPFGIIALPSLDQRETEEFLVEGKPFRVSKYEVEVDSKMFDYGLTDEEVASVMLYNIYHLTTGYAAANTVREMIDIYLMNTQTSISKKASNQYNVILAFGLVDALNQVTSCLYLPSYVQSDPFLEAVGLSEYFIPALNKLYHQIPDCDNEATRLPKLSMLEWSLRLYQNVDTERLPAINLMTKAKDLTASSLYTSRMGGIILALNRIDTTIYESTEVSTAKVPYSKLVEIEEDIAEIKIRLQNIENREDALYTLKKINVNMGILSDYLGFKDETTQGSQMGDSSDPEVERWRNAYYQYLDMRVALMDGAGLTLKDVE